MKKKDTQKVLSPQGALVNLENVQLQPIVWQSTKKIKPNKNETI